MNVYAIKKQSLKAAQLKTSMLQTVIIKILALYSDEISLQQVTEDKWLMCHTQFITDL